MSKENPSEEWIIGALKNIVRISNNQVPARKIITYPESIIFEHREVFNASLLETNIRTPSKNFRNIGDRILSVLLNSNFRKGNMALIQEFIPLFLEKIKFSVERFAPVCLVLPSVPFKCQNPLSTKHSLGFVDLGEYLMFAQFRDLCASIQSIYEPGLEIKILCDGIVYSDIFANGELDQIIAYRENCKRICNALLPNRSISLIDMSDVIATEREFNVTRVFIFDALRRLESKNSEVKIFLDSLKRGMLLNVRFSGFSTNEFISIVDSPIDQLPTEIFVTVQNASWLYASFLLTMHWLNVISKIFPLHLVNAHSCIFPHNGVPLVSESRLKRTSSFRRSTRIVRFVEALEFVNLRAVLQGIDKEPFYYLVD